MIKKHVNCTRRLISFQLSKNSSTYAQYMEHNIGYAVIKTRFFGFRASWIKTLAYENWKYTPLEKKDSIVHQAGCHASSHRFVFLNIGAPLKKKTTNNRNWWFNSWPNLIPGSLEVTMKAIETGYQLPALEVFGWWHGQPTPPLPVTYRV